MVPRPPGEERGVGVADAGVSEMSVLLDQFFDRLF